MAKSMTYKPAPSIRMHVPAEISKTSLSAKFDHVGERRNFDGLEITIQVTSINKKGQLHLNELIISNWPDDLIALTKIPGGQSSLLYKLVQWDSLPPEPCSTKTGTILFELILHAKYPSSGNPITIITDSGVNMIQRWNEDTLSWEQIVPSLSMSGEKLWATGPLDCMFCVT
jgi:hypothetical protein